MKQTACYIHIPFCEHKCIYCDFYSIITRNNIKSYLQALKTEICYYSNHFAKDRELISIYFGGGTPSLMTPHYISEIISHVRNNFNVSNKAEITLETNPGTVDKKILQQFLNAGINRLSIGIQSFNEDELKFLTRIHNENVAVKSVYDASDVGFENINIDLIYNLPKQTKDKWILNLNKAVELPIKHISAYSLILERGTILNKMVINGEVKLQDDNYDADLYEQTMDFLYENGFNQYEISNFAKPGYECVHNNAYWQYKDNFGFGASAHSFLNNKRWWNYSSLNYYSSAVNEEGHAQRGREKLTVEQQLNEYVMLAFRSSGLDLNNLEDKFGNGWILANDQIINKLSKEDYITNTNNFLKFTKKGYLICDELLASFK